MWFWYENEPILTYNEPLFFVSIPSLKLQLTIYFSFDCLLLVAIARAFLDLPRHFWKCSLPWSKFVKLILLKRLELPLDAPFLALPRTGVELTRPTALPITRPCLKAPTTVTRCSTTLIPNSDSLEIRYEILVKFLKKLIFWNTAA